MCRMQTANPKWLLLHECTSGCLLYATCQVAALSGCCAHTSLYIRSLHPGVKKCQRRTTAYSTTKSATCCMAGVMACPEGQTKDGFETQFGTNHLAHFLLFQLLQPTLLASSTPEFQSRVVSVSSSGHQISGIHFDDLDLKKQGYEKWTAYGQSKTANIYLATEASMYVQCQEIARTTMCGNGD